MIRIIAVEVDACAAANVGGPTHVKHQTFVADCPELEAFMAAKTDQFCQRSIVGVEVVQEPTK